MAPTSRFSTPASERDEALAAFADYLYNGSPYYASHFAPDPARLPEVSVRLAPLSSYDVLVDSRVGTGREVAA